MAEWLDIAQLSGACRGQLEIARQEWGERIPLTAEAMDRALELGLDLEWAALRLLHGAARQEYDRAYDSARQEYNRKRGSAWQEYNRECDSARQECQRKCDSARQECQRKCGLKLLALLQEIED